MILAVDIGNSNVVFGLNKGGEWIKVWRIFSKRDKSVYYYQMKLSQCFVEADIDESQIEAIVLSSVVPDLTKKFSAFLSVINKDAFLILDKSIYDKLEVFSINPHEIGTDLMANAIACHNRWKSDCIIVDFGTALTFSLLRANGELSGVNILPGLKTAIRALSSDAAQLHEVVLKKPAQVVGKNTVEAIQNGVLIGYTGLVNHMVKSIQQELELDCKLIATGGLSGVLDDVEFDHIDKNLTLDGLRWVAENLILSA